MLTKSKIKYIQSLSQKKVRQQEGVFVAEGPKIVEEMLLQTNVKIKQLFGTKSWTYRNVYDKAMPGEKFVEVTDTELKKISFLQTPNEVLGIFQNPDFPMFEAANKVSLMLDTIQDPGNLGTIVRCADWFGVQQIICSQDCVDIFNPKAVQATMGSICRVQVIYTDLISFIRSNSTIPMYAAALHGEDVKQHSRITEGIIVIGNESKGIDPELLNMTTHHITIPRSGKAESLNAAVATGIILSHLL